MNGMQDDRSYTEPDNYGRDRQEFLLILLSLLPLQVIYPVLSGNYTERLMMIFFFSIILIAGVWIMRGSRRRFLMAAILTLVSLELLWISLWPAAASLLVLGEFCLLLFLLILAGRSISLFIRTRLSVFDLLMAGASLYLLLGTVIGICLHLVYGLYPGSAALDLAWSLWAGMTVLTSNGLLLPVTVQSFPLFRVISMLGMICGILLICLIIGKIAAEFCKKSGMVRG
jgi:hypothetical protein